MSQAAKAALESISFMEKSLAHRVKAFGLDHDESVRQWKRLVTEYNVAAMKMLQTDDYELAMDLLNRAKELTKGDVKFGEADDRRKLLAITFNNMSCIHKKRGFLKTALGFAEKALKLEIASSKADNPACTHLNLCAILSRLGRHQHALQHCQCALDLLLGENYASGVTPGFLDEMGEEKDSSILAVCYHNMAYDKAIQSYLKSVETAGQELGMDHAITQAFESRANEAVPLLEAKLRESKRSKKVNEYDQKLAAYAKKTPRGTMR
ncbi:hypothetical protein GUITHDRAFT_117499 [Guillardia theta CCMP2712]|uniref:MalT-like TPR region domain-containing protein n=1 Tax=Guillardia theta (strain CCMP2712) TaxID=905079 RepID=L1IJ48_GUITC|nr:hypothetical protein GUITHDRAFT_117499 [Guillardia theta CCMP2712]EKX36268.1 hypothetical protein GUITHDRAFT_117499 [Guillardia theta CCMP2712]|eukprot:XP_005823248.1 hypothetical protein GUITHDRAFT_117499 [Guillardia theta CCMP2712]